MKQELQKQVQELRKYQALYFVSFYTHHSGFISKKRQLSPSLFLVSVSQNQNGCSQISLSWFHQWHFELLSSAWKLSFSKHPCWYKHTYRINPSEVLKFENPPHCNDFLWFQEIQLRKLHYRTWRKETKNALILSISKPHGKLNNVH